MNKLINKVKTTVCYLTLTSSIAIAGTDLPGEGQSITPVFPLNMEERFQGEIAIAGLEALGYKVNEPKTSEPATMILALGYGDADFTVHLWNSLHNAFYEKAGGDNTMIKAGGTIPGVLQGYLIDKATSEKYGITSLADFKKPSVANLFDNDGDGKADLTGCNPGWGCELVIDHHLNTYGLESTVSHNRGSYFALMADTITRFKEGESIFYYTWVPLWLSGVLKEDQDVVWLEAPYTDLPDGNNNLETHYNGKNLGFAVDEVMSVVNKEFALENPAALSFLSNLRIQSSDISAQNLKMREGENTLADIKNHAAQWVRQNQAVFDEWLELAKQ